MTVSIERAIRQPTRPARPAALPQKRRARAGEVEQGFVRDRSKPVARSRPSPIRAWRAAGTDPSQTAWSEARPAAKVAAAALRQASGRDAQAGARVGVLERAARMRVIEQAWKEERARQAELEAQDG
jgi:hypothetical protein